MAGVRRLGFLLSSGTHSTTLITAVLAGKTIGAGMFLSGIPVLGDIELAL